MKKQPETINYQPKTNMNPYLSDEEIGYISKVFK